jgi:hypothetical protein
MAAAPGRPKQGRAPSGGSVLHDVKSVGARKEWGSDPNSWGEVIALSQSQDDLGSDPHSFPDFYTILEG